MREIKWERRERLRKERERKKENLIQAVEKYRGRKEWKKMEKRKSYLLYYVQYTVKTALVIRILATSFIYDLDSGIKIKNSNLVL